jgi:hypothetical protein
VLAVGCLALLVMVFTAMSSRSSEALAGIRAGFAYALIVFVIGFGLGTIRVLLVVPKVGAATAVLLEAPVILLASWAVSRWCMERYRARVDVGARMLVAAVAFGTLMFAEVGLSVIVFDQSLAEHLAGYRSVAGGIGLAAQVCFASFPVLQAAIQLRSRQHRRESSSG